MLLGAQLFNTAADPRLSQSSWLSCATCHFDGQSDGRVWLGFPDGPRNTPTLYNLPETVPYNWSATWDELADVELKIRWLQVGSGLIDAQEISPALGDPHAGMSVDLDLLTQYLTTLQAPANPYRFPDDVIARGKVIFEAEQCDQCHVGPAGTDLQSHDVGTGEFAAGAARHGVRYALAARAVAERALFPRWIGGDAAVGVRTGGHAPVDRQTVGGGRRRAGRLSADVS